MDIGITVDRAIIYGSVEGKSPVGLNDVNLKAVYYSDEDDLLRDFYIPVLSNSVKYDRIAGYFSSNSLAIAAKGIAEFIKAGGRIRLIANVVLSEEDQEAIKESLREKEEEVLAEIENSARLLPFYIITLPDSGSPAVSSLIWAIVF